MNFFKSLIVGLMLSCIGLPTLQASALANPKVVWTGTWATAPQSVEPHNMPPAPGLSNNTFRQVVRTSLGGSHIRLHLTNLFSASPLQIQSAWVAVSTGDSAIDVQTKKQLRFQQQTSVEISARGAVVSDPLAFTLPAGSKLAITLCYGSVPSDLTGHPASRTYSYLITGNDPESDFSNAKRFDRWYTIHRLEVINKQSKGSIVVLGNSIADGRGSGTSKHNRWTDVLSDRLNQNKATRHVGVLNVGIGGNCVLRGGLGQTALTRFDRDVLMQENVKWLILSIGINDIGGVRSPEAAQEVVKKLIEAYQRMIDKAHAQGIKVYGATILPFAKSFYDAGHRQEMRDAFNAWIRTSKAFDAVIDLDQAIKDPNNPRCMQADAHDHDWLHPNETGYKRLGQSIDLNLFE